MKRCYLYLIIVIISQIQVLGQEATENLQAPSSPAAAVIGIQPSTILSPKSYEALETSIFSNYFNGQGQVLIPNNLAIEFTPYWTKDRPMSVENYLQPNFGESIWRNLSFSIASTQNFVISDTAKSNALGFGIRTTIYLHGDDYKENINTRMKKILDKASLASNTLTEASSILISQKLKDKNDFLNQLINKLKTNSEYIRVYNEDTLSLNKNLTELKRYLLKQMSELPNSPLDPSSKENQEYLNFLNNLIDAFFELPKEHNAIIQDLVQLRPGFKIDLAFASFLNFPTNDFNYSLSPQQSIWVTPSFQLKNNWSFLELLVVLRYNWYSLDYYKQYFPKKETFENNLDYGLSLNFTFDKVALHFEVVGRNSNSIISQTTDSTGIITTKSKNVSDFQCLGTFSYNISKKLCVSYTFGQQFQPILNYNGTLISSLSLNLGFGGPTTDKIYK